MMIDLRALSSALVSHDKFSWALFSNVIKTEVMQELSPCYPSEGYTRSERRVGPKKHYAFNLLKLVEHNIYSPPSNIIIDPKWKILADNLMSNEYADILGETLKINLKNALINIGFYRFDTMDWVAPHIDNEDKLVTQIFYFNSLWSNAWGGQFKLLKNQNPLSEFFAVPPLASFSVAIARSDCAWHMVSSIEKIAVQPRLSMQLEFIKRM